ncbi:glycoside hydrolase family 5 protein [Pseudomonas stutzeri]|uniref:glycoside hydrolase family 5 protein n=1 Tax=Stutzerimonas stutzeri TaxID=316 RepID=UPI00210BF2D2|nr:glycoside hydrolase family 5 protein [Stutzerimonas stutzeri]MCQ4286231.1 glycoside hydrolase family 5 protein [Stutzerimonas stutzeri]
MSINVFTGAPKALVRSIALAAVFSTIAVSGQAAAEISVTASSSSAFTSSINKFTSNDFLNGVWRKTAGLSVPASSAAIAAFKPGVQIKFADGQVRKITRVYVVGKNISVYVDGGLLDGNKVGAPRTVSTVVSSAEAPGTAAPAPTAPSSAITATLNNFTSGDWDRGIYRKSPGFSIPDTATNKAAFVKGASVKLADGQVRTITAVYKSGAHLSIMMGGSALSASAVGYPKTVSIGSGTSTGPTTTPSTPKPAPTPTPAPTAPSTAHSAGLNSFTNSDWENGIYRKSAGFSIPDNAANKSAFVVGASVKLADGQVRKVAAVYDVGAHLSVMLSGSALSASAVGYPKTISVVSSTGATTPPAPTPAPTPKPVPTPAPTPAPTPPVVSDGKGIDLVGVNFGSGVFDPSNVPGIYNKGYTFADESYYKRHSALGFKLVRLGFLWERVQPKLGTELDAAEMGRIMKSLDHAHKHGIKVILDMHNYYRYYGKVINSPEVPRAQFAETWRKIALQVSKHPALYGYGLMNEPYNTGNNMWPQTAQAAGQAIRKIDSSNWIMIAGDRYSSAFHWQKYNTQLINDPWMRDPKNNLVYEAHQYLDHDYSGTYRNRNETFAPMLGVERVKPWVEWLKKNKLRGYLGEHGIPDFSPSAVVATDKLLAYLAENCIPSSYWAAGPRWGENIMALDVTSGKHRPQLAPLQKHAAAKKTCSTIGPL